jgi:aspartate/methionine/tyrosine aminotransferase
MGGPSVSTSRDPFRVAARAQIEPFHVMRVVDAVTRRRAAGHAVFDLSAGQPSTPAPLGVRAAAHAALDSDLLGYGPALGQAQLRTAIAEHYRRWYAVEIAPQDVVVTTGSSGGFLLAFLAAFEPGDQVVLARPGYPAYRNMLQALGCAVVEIDAHPGGMLSVAALDALPQRPAGVVIASPANPTGTMIDAAEFAAIGDWCEANGVRLISDEIYHGITYGRRAMTARQISRPAVVVNSFSKYFSMTGWRLGWLVVPPELLDPIDRLSGNFTLCPPTLPQLAAVAAFESYDELDANVTRYARNRELLEQRLPQIGIDRIAPMDGAFYAWVDVSRWTDDALDFAARLLAQTGVAVTPGVDFDRVDGAKFIRLCYAGEYQTISDALDLLGDWLARA